MSREVNIDRDTRWFQGEDISFIIPVVDTNSGVGSPVTMTGFSLAWFLYTSAADDHTELLAKTTAGGSITLVAVDGTDDGAKIAIVDSDTIVQATGVETIPAGTYWHELWRVDENNERLLAAGYAVLRPSSRRQETS